MSCSGEIKAPIFQKDIIYYKFIPDNYTDIPHIYEVCGIFFTRNSLEIHSKFTPTLHQLCDNFVTTLWQLCDNTKNIKFKM